MVRFIDDHRHEYGVEPICRVLPIAPSTYYSFTASERDPTLAFLALFRFKWGMIRTLLLSALAGMLYYLIFLGRAGATMMPSNS